MTTRAAIRFSCTAPFIVSYFFSMTSKRLKPTRIIMNISSAMTGIANRKITASSASMRNAMIAARIIMTGVRTKMRSSC